MEKKKNVASDFRYDTGEAKIPWAAVGENIRENDIMDIVRFLIRPAEREGQGR